MKIDQEFDYTQREFIVNLARMIYASEGCILPQDPQYLWKSRHPREMAILQLAEQIYEMLMGDTPDYSDEYDDADVYDYSAWPP